MHDSHVVCHYWRESEEPQLTIELIRNLCKVSVWSFVTHKFDLDVVCLHLILKLFIHSNFFLVDR
jgi:hypothetical protein